MNHKNRGLPLLNFEKEICFVSLLIYQLAYCMDAAFAVESDV